MKTFSWTMTIPVPDIVSRALSPSVSFKKEVRAILPALLLGALLGLLAILPMRNRELSDGNFISLTFTFTLLLYPLACSGIGALAFGHDYIHRTLGSFLSLPIPRSKIWWMRLRISFLAMLPLAFLQIACFNSLALWAFFSGIHVNMDRWYLVLRVQAQSAAVPMLSGLFLAPWLTLVSRSPLFGTIVSMILPFILGLISTSLLVASGFDQQETPWQPLRLIPMIVLSIVFGILGWRKFKSLEVIDGEIGAAARCSTRGLRADQIRRQSPMLQLFRKNLMLLRMPILLAVLGMLLTLFLNEGQAALWTLVYPAAIVVLIGAVSSADERQLGVAEWQTLIPVAFWKQWTIKFFVTWLSALVAGVILPLLILYLRTDELKKVSSDFLQVGGVFVVASLGFITITLYVSSLCNSGLKALIAAILVNIGVAYMMIQFFDAYSTLLWNNGIVGSREIMERLPDGSRMQRTLAVPVEKGDWWNYWQYSPFVLAIIGFVLLGFFLAMRNHRYAERGPGRLLRQITAFAAYEAGAAALITIFWNWYSWLH
jgi:hypothetical protein